MAINERVYTISGDLINEIISSNTIRDQDVQDRVIAKLETLVREQDEPVSSPEPPPVDAPPLNEQKGDRIWTPAEKANAAKKLVGRGSTSGF